MEDALYYIGLGLIITFSLIRKVRKEAAKSKSKRNSAPQNQPPAELSEILNELKKMEGAYKSTQKQKRVEANTDTDSTNKRAHAQSATMPTQNCNEAQSLEIIFDEEEEFMKHGSDHHKTTYTTVKESAAKKAVANTGKAQKSENKAKNSTAKKAVANTGKAQKPENKAKNSENSTNGEEFNLRDAVIYSEILKPKFEE